MSSMDKLASELKTLITESDGRKPTAYDTTATVVRAEDDILWVHIPGGVDETPVRKTINATAGDSVQLRVANGSAWITGNDTRPPTDDARAIIAENKATDAQYQAAIATNYANEAQLQANRAKDSADRAVASAEIAETSAEIAIANAAIAQTEAIKANESAINATNSANAALSQLGVVEDVVGVLDLISKNGTYELTQDTEILPDKWYFERVGEAPNYEYRVVENPDVAQINTYYELTGVDESIQNYVSSHLVLTNQGLWVQVSDSSTKVLLSPTRGLVMYGTDGQEVAQYGETTIIGKQSGFHIEMGVNEQSGRLSFYQGAKEVAYISNNQLYITQSVVLQQMDIGEPMVNGIGGQWSWKVSRNAEGKNNLYLKWIG